MTTEQQKAEIETTDPTPERAEETIDKTANREAAKYRRRLRETEELASGLAERLEAMQRREIERLAATELQVPGDMWLIASLVNLLDDDGEVDEAKVAEAVNAVIESRPGLRKQPSPPTFDAGVRTSAPQPVTMQDVLQGWRRRR